MMLIAASCPSKSEAAVTNLSGTSREGSDAPSRSLRAVLMSKFSGDIARNTAEVAPVFFLKTVTSSVAIILIEIKIMDSRRKLKPPDDD
jgi:hypothetical protein